MEGYVTTRQAADALGVTTGRVNALIRDGVLDAVRFGKAYAVSAESVERRIRSNPGPGNPDFKEPGYHGKAGRRPQPPDGHMSVNEAAAALGVTDARVRELVGENVLSCIRADGRMWVSAESVPTRIHDGPRKPGRKKKRA